MRNGAIVFRIVGVAFIVVAVLIAVRGDVVVGRTGGGGRVITRVDDPASFWRTTIMLAGVGCAALYASRFVNRNH